MTQSAVSDHVQMVLDDDHGIPQVREPVEHVQQLLDVVEVQAGGGLVQNVQGASGLALGSVARQLEACASPPESVVAD